MTLVRYILREVFLAFIVTFGGLTILAIAGVLMQMYRHLSGLGLGFLLASLPSVAGYVAPWTLLVSVVIATTLVMSRLATDGELEAMRTSGVSLTLIPAAMIVPAIAFCILAGSLTMWLAPKAFTMRWVVMENTVTALLHEPPPGRQVLPIGRTRLNYRGTRDVAEHDLAQCPWGQRILDEYGRAGGIILEEPFIVEIAADGRTVAWALADVAHIHWLADGEPVALLERATIFHREGDEETQFDAAATEWPLPLPKSDEEDVGIAGHSMRQLLDRAATDLEDEVVLRALTEFHERIATGVAPLALIALAVGLGMSVPRAARLAGLGVSLPLLGAFLVLHLGGASWAEDGRVPVWVGPYLGDLLGLVAGTFLILKQVKR